MLGSDPLSGYTSYVFDDCHHVHINSHGNGDTHTHTHIRIEWFLGWLLIINTAYTLLGGIAHTHTRTHTRCARNWVAGDKMVVPNRPHYLVYLLPVGLSLAVLNTVGRGGFD